jgi:hypothetical protein
VIEHFLARHPETPIAATEEEYVAGFNQGKEEGAKILIQSLPKGAPSGHVKESQIQNCDRECGF